MIGEKNQLTLLILITILASGCAANGSTSNSQNTGTGPISVNSFDGTPNPATADRRVNINLELENTGDADAERVAAQFFGPTWAQSNTDTQAWRDSSGEEVTQEERTLFYNSLRAPGENTPSVPKQKSLTLTAPELSQGREIDYTFKTNIFYKYETTANTNFKLVSGERFRDQEMERTDASVESSSGPIQLEIRGTTPKIFYKDDNEQGINSEICIKATNQGSGTPFINGEVDSDRKYDVSENNKNKILLSIQDISNVDFTSKDTGENTVRVELVGGNEGFQCYNMDASDLGTQEEQTINTQITAQYSYMKEDETTVTVEGRRGLNDEQINDPGPEENEESSEDNEENNEDDNSEDEEESDDEEDETEGTEYRWTGDENGLVWQTADGDTVDEKCSDLEERANSGDIDEDLYTDNCEVR